MVHLNPAVSIPLRLNNLPQLSAEDRCALRLNYAVPVALYIADDVPTHMAGAAVQGVIDVINRSGHPRELMIFDRTTKDKWPTWSAERIIEASVTNEEFPARLHGNTRILRVEALSQALVYDENQATPHWPILLLNQHLEGNLTMDQGYETISWVFGAVIQNYMTCVQSVSRFTEPGCTRHIQELAVRRLLRHEVGHMYGLFTLPHFRNHHADLRAAGTPHCSELCSMQQGESNQKWVDCAVREELNKVCFCPYCQQDLLRNASRLGPVVR